jgi:hypothetical protein
MERYYRLEFLSREEFEDAIVAIGVAFDFEVGGRVLFTFRDGWLTLKRSTWMGCVVAETTVSASGWWHGPVSVDWHELKRTADYWMLLPCYVTFSYGTRAFGIGPHLFEGRPEPEETKLVVARTSSAADAVDPATAAYDALIERIAAIDAETAGKPPAKVRETAERYERDAALVRLLKQARGGQCQICGHTFKMRNGDTYTEAHHLEQLANGGLDVPRNMLIVCANHHRQFHYGDVEIIEHTADTLVVRLDDKVHTVSLAFA